MKYRGVRKDTENILSFATHTNKIWGPHGFLPHTWTNLHESSVIEFWKSCKLIYMSSRLTCNLVCTTHRCIGMINKLVKNSSVITTVYIFEFDSESFDHVVCGP